MRYYADTKGCSAIAIQCWSALQDSMHIMPCLANAILTDEFIPVTCETDVHGAITSILAQEAALRKTPTFFADLTVRHSENENGEQYAEKIVLDVAASENQCRFSRRPG